MLCKSVSLLSINLLFYIILFQIGFISVNASLTCRDETGKAVDWYLLYKLPSNKNKKNGPGIGTQYMYITPNTVSNGWILSKKYITNSTSIPAYTLKPLYNKTTDMLWILYNDQPPKGDYGKYKGHTKGVVGADKTGGFWLVHSVPRFPPSPPDSNNYSYPFTGYKFGQSFLCMTLKAGELDNVGLQLQYNQINVYWANISDTLAKKYPKLSAAGNGTVVRKAPWTNLITITTESGHEFFSFAKTSKFKKDLYEDWVASELKTDLYVETWPNGVGRLSSNCSLKYSVKNVEQIKVCQVTECSSFESTRDHSKWAVSTTKTNPWLCVGDINRALSQEIRGGGTVCLRNATIWESYYNSVAEVQACQRNKGLHDNIRVISV